MTATAELLHPSPSSRDALAPRPRKPRRRAFRRSEHARFRFVELDPPIHDVAEQSFSERFWERYAIPTGMGVFLLVFAVSNSGPLLDWLAR
jgi:hypothetical protein